jgi:DNA-binding LacI/PurR family transcriptional regulator
VFLAEGPAMPATKERLIRVPFSVHERLYLKQVLNGIAAYARRRGGWRLDIPFYYHATAPFSMAREERNPADGIIAGVPTREHLAPIRRKGVPTVLLNCPPPVPEWAGGVGMNYPAVAKLAVGHLLDQGIQSLAFFGSTHPERTDHALFLEAVANAASADGMEVLPYDRLPPGGNWVDFAGVRRQWREWIGGLPDGTGLICADDEQAVRAYHAAEEADRVIGKDLFVLSVGNDEVVCESMTPPLTSIQLDYYAIGWEAAATLDRIMGTGEIPAESQPIHFASLISRQSSRPDAHLNPQVERALAVVREEMGAGLTVDKLATRMNMDRRYLHRLFVNHLGRSPMTEIQRTRVEAAKRMLCENTASIAAIATVCGFSDQAHLSRAIKKATGRTPSEFRLIGRKN